MSDWLQPGGIRLRMEGKLSRRQMNDRYRRLDKYPLDLILNGHNPRPIENPKAALKKVLSRGEYWVHRKGAITMMWADKI